MNQHALRMCVAARHWRALADFFVNNKQSHSRLTGMPTDKSTEKSLRDLCSLYILADRKMEFRGPRMNRADEKRLAEQITWYKRDFSDIFSDGLLDEMKTFEDNNGESMADIIDTKYGTNVPLNWTSKDTEAATELATKLRSDYRTETEDTDAEQVELRQWHAFMTFEVRIRIIADRANQGKKVAKAKPSGEYLLS